MLKIVLPCFVLLLVPFWPLTLIYIPIAILSITVMSFMPVASYSFLSPMITIDPMSTSMITLTLWITMMMMLSSMKILISNAQPMFFMRMTISLTLVLTMAFSVNTLMSYYIMFESTIIPTLILILTWGYQPERLQAGMYLTMYMMVSSLPLLMGTLYLYLTTNSTLFYLPHPIQTPNHVLNLALTFAFLVKMPMYPMHLWLPKAHVEAPVAGSMVLAGVLLKLGPYGLMRLATMVPTTLKTGNSTIISLALMGSLIAAGSCLRQHDMKSLIAYASISHMGLVVAGVYSMSSWGWGGSLAMMIAHGLSSSGLFSMANLMYENSKTRSILMTKGLLLIHPSTALWWFLLLAANMSTPPTLNFMAEIALVNSTLFVSLALAPVIFLLVFISVAYSMTFYTNMHHGKPSSHMKFFSSTNMMTTVFMLHILPLFLLTPCLPILLQWQ